MELTWIKHNSRNARLILIFAGWSTHADMYPRLDLPGWDVAVVHDYGNDVLDMSFLWRYCTVYLFAWSLGVAEADRILPPDRITAAFAINGTVTPVSDRYGIPTAIYHGTADGLNPRTLGKFRRRMMPDAETCRRFFTAPASDAECIRLADELRSIAARNPEQKTVPSLQWTRAYISANDRIFPPGNMKASWSLDSDVAIVETGDSHYMDLTAIIAGVIPDTMKVSQRFTSASATYDSYAIAQQMIALHLSRLVRTNIDISDVRDVLEIGPGTGFLTNSLSTFLRQRHTDFVDITEIGPFKVNGTAHYHIQDAELWMQGCQHTYDLIVSSSVIQWFADIPKFLQHCGRVLRPGALLAIASFLPGNLSELDALRPSPLLYPDADTLLRGMDPDFDVLILEHNDIRLEFESRRQLLVHLKRTGVGGSASASSNKVPQITALTYRPVYLLARRR